MSLCTLQKAYWSCSCSEVWLEWISIFLLWWWFTFADSINLKSNFVPLNWHNNSCKSAKTRFIPPAAFCIRCHDVHVSSFFSAATKHCFLAAGLKSRGKERKEEWQNHVWLFIFGQSKYITWWKQKPQVDFDLSKLQHCTVFERNQMVWVHLT